ncbi:MAG: mannose-1-phosphate guanyltransferase [Actinobacteria bacterium HGW-Actinobacteria-1]|nr:MAG: mannose-1-phosphate guanyltransferase [Actinobacteria bacterium HGW-Actinobacteria-1]
MSVKAVIMAGGEGTRLRPLTSTRPKPMVPIVNQPVMEHILGLVKHYGITEVVATLAFMPQVIEDYFGDGEEWGTTITYAVEESPLGTAGSVKNAEDALRGGPFVVISGDALTDIDLAEVIEFHASHDGPVTIALTRVPDPLDFGVVITDDDGKIQRFLEKPTWGQVFSDTINTGIYVLDPIVFDFIPEGVPYDFSSELFPALMAAGHSLYGFVTDGYWCDVGSLESYVEVHRDILDGKAKIYVPGAKARNDVWVGKGADIDPGAVIGSKVVVGANTRVRAGAHVDDYTVIGDNCLVGYDTVLEHSIVWSDSFVGAGSELRGAVVCRGVDIRARARIEPGAAIGDATVVGHGAIVGNGVQVYPYKRIEAGALVASSLIWESTGIRSLFGADGVAGLVNIDITPELALRVAQAFGSILPSKAHVVVSRDSSRGARMVKRAIVAGLNSTGNHVRDLRVASPGITRFTTRDTRCEGGVHVCASSKDPQTLELHFYDKAGIDLAPWIEKKVERLYFRQEFRRAFFGEIGEIIYPPRALEYYTAGLMDALDGTRALMSRRQTIVVDMGMSPASFVLPQVAGRWDVEVIALRPFVDSESTAPVGPGRDEVLQQMARSMDIFRADLGISMDSTAERVTLVTGSGRVLDADTALHAMLYMWCRTDHGDRCAAVPLTASRVIEAIASETGHCVSRVGTSRRSLSAAALNPEIGFAGSQTGGFVFPSFLASYDAVMSLGMTLRMLDRLGMTLDEVVDALPPFHLRRRQVFCPFDRKGAVMRQMAEFGQHREVEMTEGVRVVEDEGWALVLPHASDAIVEVFTEGDSDSAADAIADRYVALVEAAIREE